MVDSIVIVVSPLNSLMSNQISRLGMSGIRASFVNVKGTTRTRASQSANNDVDDDDEVETSNINIDFCLCDEKKLQDGYYHIVFAHPESLISSSYGRQLLLSQRYQENVVGIVTDEAHCIVEW